LPVARWLRKPVVMKVSGSGIITTMRGTFLGRIELSWLRRWARRVMVLNPGMAEEAYQSGFEPRRLLWMPNPVDVSDFAPLSPEDRERLRSRLGIAPGHVLILYAGRLAPEKELWSLLEGVALLKPGAPQLRLTLVGDGPSRPDLEARAATLGMAGRVMFTGRVTVDEVREWMQASDAFALVSSNEGFPCSLIEAMSVGLPSLVSDIPANLQLVDDGVHGVHAPMGKPDAIAAQLSRLAFDPSARMRMGRAARQRIVENYSTDKVLEKYEALFEEALAEAS
jgi:glycosyltransferase involved in cell wall biosynthesis